MHRGVSVDTLMDVTVQALAVQNRVLETAVSCVAVHLLTPLFPPAWVKL
jgi:hypothetical protein